MVLRGMVLWVAGLISATSTAPDVTRNFSAAYQACITYGERAGTTAIPLAACNARELRRQDNRLNASYRGAMARLSPTRRFALRTDQRDWIKARDRTCGALQIENERIECVIDRTITRTRQLRRYR